MVPFLYTPREHHNAQSVDEYLRRHAEAIARRAARGARYVVHESPAMAFARVDANSWIIDCECGAGNATDPAWSLACCFGCGAVHRNITFPIDRGLITDLLVARQDVPRRGWDLGQSVVDLVRENVSVQADVPDHVVNAIVAADVVG